MVLYIVASMNAIADVAALVVLKPMRLRQSRADAKA